jgi:O-antigen/teichoic acid export membrane protein
MVVSLPSKAKAERQFFAARILIATMVFASVGAAFMLCISLIAITLIGLNSVYSDAILPLALACIFYLVKDYFLRYAYSQHREIWALKINSTIALVSILLILPLDYLDLNLNASIALTIFAVGQLGGGIAGYCLTKPPLFLVTWDDLTKDTKDMMQLGRWSLAANITNWIRTQGYVFFASIAAGPAGVAAINAVKILITPAVFLLPAVGQIALPRFAVLAVENRNAVTSAALVFLAISITASTIYSLSLLAFIEPVIALVLGEKYVPYQSMAFAWMAFMLGHVTLTCITLILQSLKEFPIIFSASLTGTAAMLIAIYPLHYIADNSGIVYAMFLGELAASAVLLRKFYRITL